MDAPTKFSHASPAPPRADSAERSFAALTSIVLGVAIFAAKLVAWRLTNSSAVLSDAMESVVNVLAAAFAFAAIRFAAQPADREHPYGHGKVEYLAAAFEGGLITFAAVLIVYQAVHQMWEGPSVRKLELGLAVTAVAALANLGLGAFLVRSGRRLKSPTLVADGQHVLSDVWTTAGVLVGLGLVRFTGIVWFDPIAALAVGLWLARVGIGLVSGAAGTLVDRENTALNERLVAAFNEVRTPGLIGIHKLRALDHGSDVHIDAHIFVPETWTIRESHDWSVGLEEHVKERTGIAGEIAFHLDPCRALFCATCNVADCPVRKAPFAALRPFTVEESCGTDDVG